jgi:predicted GTPase
VIDIRFGEHYFATRERLSEVMHGIADLAKDTHTALGDVLPLAELANGLDTPFLFVVCGEVNAGKSTLINGLFGADLCSVNSLPETDRVFHYRFGGNARDFIITPMLEERFRPFSFLQDFNLIDTPGTNSTVKSPQDTTDKFLQIADLILFVFPVSNPWGAATWNSISRLPKDCLERVAFVIQQADKREAIDLHVIRGHMADLAMKHIGRTPPIFAISAKTAYEAKQSKPTNDILLKKSGIIELERFISKNICESAPRKQVLEIWRSHATAALRAIDDRIEDQTRELSQQGRFLESVEREIDEIREKFVARLTRHLEGVAEVFETEGTWVSRKLRRKLGVFSSVYRLFFGDRTGVEMEAVFIERLQTAVESVAEKDGGEVVEFCRQHWNDLIDRVKESMNIDMDDSASLDETLIEAKKHFIQRLGRAARQGIANLKVRNQLDKELRSRNIALKSFTFMTLILITAGASCGALRVPWAPAILCGLSGFFVISGSITARMTRKSISDEFQKRLLDTCGGFASTLRSDYEEALHIVFQDYLSSLGIVRTHLAQEKIAVEPRMKRWQGLFLTLKAIEQEL